MPVTLTIKQVPDALARKLRARAAARHRSLQGELMAILHEAITDQPIAFQPDPAPYRVKASAKARKAPEHGRRLTLEELWQRSRRLGPKSPSESTAIVRRLREERHGR
jgi:plasmid stability protein